MNCLMLHLVNEFASTIWLGWTEPPHIYYFWLVNFNLIIKTRDFRAPQPTKNRSANTCITPTNSQLRWMNGELKDQLLSCIYICFNTKATELECSSCRWIVWWWPEVEGETGNKTWGFLSWNLYAYCRRKFETMKYKLLHLDDSKTASRCSMQDHLWNRAPLTRELVRSTSSNRTSKTGK